MKKKMVGSNEESGIKKRIDRKKKIMLGMK